MKPKGWKSQKKGWEKAHRRFNSTIVTENMLNEIFKSAKAPL